MNPKGEVENAEGIVMKVEFTRNSNKYEERDPEKTNPNALMEN
jgi:hypothetical protein